MEGPYIVYAKTDAENRITDINSSAFLSGMDGWTEIDRGYGDSYHHAHGNYLPRTIMDGRGIYCYRLVDGAVQERSAAEMDEEFDARGEPEPTDTELLLEMAADHEYRICLMELGVSEDDL